MTSSELESTSGDCWCLAVVLAMGGRAVGLPIGSEKDKGYISILTRSLDPNIMYTCIKMTAKIKKM